MMEARFLTIEEDGHFPGGGDREPGGNGRRALLCASRAFAQLLSGRCGAERRHTFRHNRTNVRPTPALVHLRGLNGSEQLTNLLAKLDARDRVHAVVLAYEAGIVGPGGGTEIPRP